MTQQAIDLQNQAIKELVAVFKDKKEITFKAPTGSGKTYMMAAFMNEILREEEAIFIVSSLSKGALAQQNFKAFENFKNDFKNLKPFLIQSEDKGEGQIYIPSDYNVYVLARDLYKGKSKIKEQGVLENFLRECKGLNADLSNLITPQRAKNVCLIKDECHIETSNLNELIADAKKDKGFFDKLVNISATPSSKKGQFPDVSISEEEAMSAKLIKEVEYFEEEEDLQDGLNKALSKFVELKKRYLESLGINPCLIIQISNKDKADSQIKEIKGVLNANFNALRWILIMDKEKDCDTNDSFKAKNLPVKKWKNYAKENASLIDVIIFKMVISEGWDIPRACMLYQVRDSKSKQLDEQVIGRVRRNPCLLNFENLKLEAQNLISKAYVWGIKPQSETSVAVRLKGQDFGKKDSFKELQNEIQREFNIITSRLKRVELKREFKAGELENILQKEDTSNKNIFELYRAGKNHKELSKICEEYVNGAENENEAFARWFAFAKGQESVKKAFENAVCDYESNIELIIPQNVEAILPLESAFSMSEYKKKSSIKWIWQRADKSNEFCFDSDAERMWLEFLIDLYDEEAPNGKRLIKEIQINNEKIYLLGKNYPYRSNLKFEYYLNGYHFSYPDFIIKDWQDRIHIFEVKSANKSSKQNIDTEEYQAKIKALKQCYQAVAKKINEKFKSKRYHFYIPNLKNETWVIWHSEVEKMGQDDLKDLLKRA